MMMGLLLKILSFVELFDFGLLLNFFGVVMDILLMFVEPPRFSLGSPYELQTLE